MHYTDNKVQILGPFPRELRVFVSVSVFLLGVIENGSVTALALLLVRLVIMTKRS